MNIKKTIISIWAGFACIMISFLAMSGTTYALFVDQAKNNENSIKSGMLYAELLKTDGSLAENLFSDEIWLPEEEKKATLLLKNKGNIDLRYTVSINVDNNEDIKLSDAMEYKKNDEWYPVQETIEEYCTGTVKAGEEQEINVSLRLKNEPGIEYLGKSAQIMIYVNTEQLQTTE